MPQTQATVKTGQIIILFPDPYQKNPCCPCPRSTVPVDILRFNDPAPENHGPIKRSPPGRILTSRSRKDLSSSQTRHCDTAELNTCLTRAAASKHPRQRPPVQEKVLGGKKHRRKDQQTRKKSTRRDNKKQNKKNFAGSISLHQSQAAFTDAAAVAAASTSPLIFQAAVAATSGPRWSVTEGESLAEVSRQFRENEFLTHISLSRFRLNALPTALYPVFAPR